MGCVCCSLSTFISIILHALERITLCTVCAMLVCCILFTILAVLIMGIGIGFHYCEVQNSVDSMANAAKQSNRVNLDGRRTGDQPQLRSINTAVKRGFAHRLGRRDRADELMPSNNNTINDFILGRNATAIHLMPGRNLSSFNNVIVASNAITVNDSSFGRNVTVLMRRPKRDLDLQLELNNTTALTNDTTPEFDHTNLNYSNVTISSKKLLKNVPVSNISIHDAIALRQNCTLLNFFTRFLHI